MKKIKIKIVGFWDSYKPEQNLICRILEKYYDVEYSDNPDYLICGIYWNDGFYRFLDYPQIRILYSFENYVPDLNFFDYGISPYPLSLFDRHLCFPVCLDGWHGRFEKLLEKDRTYSKTILNKKPYFANFIYSHESEDGVRGEFFNELCKYKRVESPGSYLNNMSDGKCVNFMNDSKADFQRKCKFSLCFESTMHKGFVTEKITDAFFADTIPIYYGSDTVSEIFNPKAFINCSDYSSMEEVIDKIKEIDRDDDLYISILSEPILVDKNYYQQKMKETELFICNIFDQPLEKAFRRSKVYWPKKYENYIKSLNKVNDAVQRKEIYDYFSGKELIKLAVNKLFPNKG